jgi:hypothetical protein
MSRGAGLVARPDLAHNAIGVIGPDRSYHHLVTGAQYSWIEVLTVVCTPLQTSRTMRLRSTMVGTRPSRHS